MVPKFIYRKVLRPIPGINLLCQMFLNFLLFFFCSRFPHTVANAILLQTYWQVGVRTLARLTNSFLFTTADTKIYRCPQFRLTAHLYACEMERETVGKNSTSKSEYSNWSVVYGHNLSLERQMNFKHSFFVDGKICVLGCRIIWIFLDPSWFVLTSPSEMINLRI